MKRFAILTRDGRKLGEIIDESRRKALAKAKQANANGDSGMRFAYRAAFMEEVK